MLNKRNRVLAGIGAAMAILALAGCETSNTSKDGRSEGRAVDDKNITADIKKSLENEPTYKFNGVDVQTFAGVVSLSGFVATQSQKDRAQEIAQHTGGVTEVVNGITVKPILPATGRTDVGPRIFAEPQNPAMPGNTNNEINQGK